jgi:hypothetical protein
MGSRLEEWTAASHLAHGELEAARRIAEGRAADEAAARRAEQQRMEREREVLTGRLDELRRDAEAARATMGLERDASARERAAFTLRLEGAERELERTRSALEEERRLAASDRARFLEQLQELERATASHSQAARSTLGTLAEELESCVPRRDVPRRPRRSSRTERRARRCRTAPVPRPPARRHPPQGVSAPPPAPRLEAAVAPCAPCYGVCSRMAAAQ